MRPDWATVAAEICAALAPFDPTPIGTPPLALDLPDSDIDIACHAPDPIAFAEHLWVRFAQADGFSIRQWCDRGRPVIARFRHRTWFIEIFGAAEPVAVQMGYRHFMIERRLLGLGGAALHAAVLEARKAGAKTEPAFAAVLGLTGDPYAALLALEPLGDRDLAGLIAAAFGREPCASSPIC